MAHLRSATPLTVVSILVGFVQRDNVKNSTIQTQRRTTFLYRNSPVRFQAIGSVDTLHLTTPGVEKKNDHVIANVPRPINEPSADRIGINAPTPRRTAVVNSIMPSR